MCVKTFFGKKATLNYLIKFLSRIANFIPNYLLAFFPPWFVGGWYVRVPSAFIL